MDSDSRVGQAQVTLRVRNPNVGPQVTVTEPADGSSAPAGTAITLAATATDDFDGDMSGQIAWTSDVAGPLGTGATLTVVLAEGTHVITASVTDSDGVLGSAQVTVNVLPTPPVVTITLPAAPATIFAGDALTFTATAVDVTDGDLSAAIGWSSSLDGALFTGATFTTTGLGIGTHVITAAATDSGGLPGEATVAVVVRPPNVPPVIAIDSPSDGAVALSGQAVLLSATATDAEDGDLSGQVGWTSSIDGELGTGAPLTVSTLSAGAHVITASVADLDGAAASASVTVTVGAQTLTVPVEADTYVDAGVPDGIFGTDTVLKIDSSRERISYLRFNVVGMSPFAVQQATLRLTVGPKSSNGSDNGGTVHAISDGSWTEAATTYNNRPAIDGPALASQGKVRAKDVVDFDVTAALGADGSYNFALISTSSDAAGYDSREAGSGQPQLIITLKQNTPPVVAITAPAPDTTVLPGTSLTLTGTATDVEDGDLAGSIQWTSSIQGALGTGASVTGMLDPGQHTITADVIDSSGASATAEVTVNVGSPPAVTITAPADGATVFTTGGAPPVASVSFTGGATDSIDGDLSASIVWTSSIDGSLGTGSSITASLGVGLHTITAAVTDSEGITSQAQIALRVRTPNVAPVVSITTPPSGASSPAGTPLTIAGAANDDFDGDISAQIQWTSDVDGALGTGATISVTLSEGPQILTASATDSDGATSDAQVAITITPTPPVVTITAPSPGPIAPLGPARVFEKGPRWLVAADRGLRLALQVVGAHPCGEACPIAAHLARGTERPGGVD